MEISAKINQTIAKMNWWKKTMPPLLGGNNKEAAKSRIQSAAFTEIASSDKARDISKSAKKAKEEALILKDAIKPGKTLSVLYWEDSSGKHSFYTNDYDVVKNEA